MRPGDPPTLDNARSFLEVQLFDQRRYDLERVGRYKLNQRLQLDGDIPRTVRTITKHDLMKLIGHMIRINNDDADPDDIDHLGNRRVKTVGELIQNKLRIGLRRTERVVRERMSIREQESDACYARQHSPDRCRYSRVLRIEPIVAVHGANQPAR